MSYPWSSKYKSAPLDPKLYSEEQVAGSIKQLPANDPSWSITYTNPPYTEPVRRVDTLPAEKQCGSCHIVKDGSEFYVYRKRNGRRTYSGYCKLCHRVYSGEQQTSKGS